MATAGHSRRRGGTPPSASSHRLLDLLRTVANIATGRSNRSRSKSRRRRNSHEPRLQATRARPAAWIVKRDVSAGRLAAAGVLALALMWIGWRVVADTTAHNLASSAPAEALSWMSGSAAALDQRSLSELKKSDGDVSAAETWARQALRAQPLDQYALFLLGMAAERKGDAADALSLMQQAGGRTWRNPGTQLWLFEHAAKRGDFSTALQHADAMFRVEPNFVTAMFPTIAAFTVEPRGLQALADFLVTSPPWRDTVMLALSARLYDRSHLDQIYSILMQSPSPPTTRELAAYLDRLIRDGRYEVAYRTWRQSTQALPTSTVEFPYNGDFERPADGLPFNWSIGSIPGADVSIVPADGAKGRALRVEFSGARVQFAHVQQMLLLPPGRYRLSGRVRADNLEGPRGLWWTVLCAGTPATPLGHSDLVSGNVPWAEFHAEFVVPERCKAQLLRLELPARIPSEQQIEGRVWYQALRITSAGQTEQKPGE